MLLFFFKQKTAYEVRISDWSSDVCSSDLHVAFQITVAGGVQIKHVLRQRTMHTGQLAAQHSKARTTELGSGVAVQPALVLPQFDMVLHRKIESARRTAPIQPGRASGRDRVRQDG